MNRSQTITSEDILAYDPERGAIIRLADLSLPCGCQDGDQFEGSVTIRHMDGREEQYEAVVEVVPSSLSPVGKEMPRHLAVLLKSLGSCDGLVGSRCTIDLRDNALKSRISF